MASPLQTAKQSVDLTGPGVRASRIRRDPVPAAKQTVVPDRDERDQRIVVIGILAFALAISIIIIGASSVLGWSPGQYSFHVEE